MEARLESDHPAFDRWCSHLSRSRASKAVQIWMRSAFSVVPTKLLTRKHCCPKQDRLSLVTR